MSVLERVNQFVQECNETNFSLFQMNIGLLDDGHGINEFAFLELHPLLLLFYSEEDFAMELRNAIIGKN